MKRIPRKMTGRMASAIARVLKDKREELALSVDEFAVRSKIKPARLALLEDCQRAPYIDELELLASGFGMPLLRFVEEICAVADGPVEQGAPSPHRKDMDGAAP